MMKKNSTLSFRVSSGLKNIIGKDLISDKYIAVFELVKNSYDAGASNVSISFVRLDTGADQIVISDNGSGMTYDDIVNKWLFVAYSEKKPQNRNKTETNAKSKRELAGAKGVGRFSCDRLGEKLTLVTKTTGDKRANQVVVQWNKFELDDTQEFMSIPVDYSETDALPSGFEKGTTLIVDDLREGWNRDDLLRLKRSLMKLISPDVDKGEIPFDIELIVPAELEKDKVQLKKRGINVDRDIVNGIVRNDIFEKLNIKTTSVEVVVSNDGKTITSKLFDRGEFIFSVVEKNKKYPFLKDISIKVFYLNQSAKVSFTRQMGGVQPKNYGSVFIYKNGFRIYPYGEPKQDFFGIDNRKAQGWKRFLGTREIMGRISIKGDGSYFVETSSRAHGFIQTEAVKNLGELFLEKVIKVLEKYVVNLINWGEPLKTNLNHTISPDEVSDQIISQFIACVAPEDVIKVEYNPSVLETPTHIADDESIKTSIKKIEIVAEQTKDANLLGLVQNLKRRTEQIVSENIELEEENAERARQLARAESEKKVREQQIFFLKGTANQNVTNLVNGYHSIYTLTDAAKGNINYLRDMIEKTNISEKEIILVILGQIYQSNEKAHKLADLAIHGNQTLRQKGSNSILDFVRQYIDAGLALNGLDYQLQSADQSFDCKFDTSSIGVIIDNIASNSLKAGASVLKITFSETNKNVEISFADNGMGLASDIDPDALFEWGFSSNRRNRGFGIGLYHIKQLVEEMKGTVTIDTSYAEGFRLIVRLKK